MGKRGELMVNGIGSIGSEAEKMSVKTGWNEKDLLLNYRLFSLVK